MSHCDKHTEDTIDFMDCPLCALEKRVEELERFKANIHSQPFIPHPSTVSASPLEPKLYSGFTAEEWELMFRDGPLLLEQPNKRLIWVDQFETEGDVPLFSWGEHITFIHEVKLIEQPNWRPHMTDECPVPERVKVKIKHDDQDYASGNASAFIWERRGHCSDIHAYLILGAEQ